MTLASDVNALAGYRRAIARRPTEVTFQRIGGQAPNVGVTSATVNALVMSYTKEADIMPVHPEGGVTLGDRMIIVLADDLAAQNFPLPLRKNDKAVVAGETLNVETLDPFKRNIAGAIEIQAKGTR